MRITDITTHVVGNPWKNWVFCVVHTDEGLTGLGEGTLNGFGRTVEAAIHELKPLVLGRDPRDVADVALHLWRDVFSDGGQVHGSALAAIELACWDILGKAAGLPLYRLWGGRCHERLRVYANGWYRGEGGRTPEAFAAQAREVVRRGYTALKFDPFGAAWRVVDRREFDLAIDLIAAVREAVGPEVDILIEGHNRFTVSTALQFAERMAPYRPAWFEAPVPPQRVRATVEVARRSPVPVAVGEDYYCREQFAELLSYDAVHIVQLEPQFLGMTAARDVVGMAQAHEAVTAPHSAQGPVCSLACAHLNMASPNFYIHEMFDEFNEPWENRLLTHPLRVVDGAVVPPDRPGLGTELDLDEVRRHPYQVSNYLPLFKSGWEKRTGDPEAGGAG
ncbi:MAG: mandelate racemase/muconate lactonizing enzyme family protein [Firmicutes bacterium]|nr:mandelate racemase/muconate lactonizing enzyme family protein [Bacillota bacterium]